MTLNTMVILTFTRVGLNANSGIRMGGRIINAAMMDITYHGATKKPAARQPVLLGSAKNVTKKVS